MLSMPLINQEGKVFGVVQLLNKKNLSKFLAADLITLKRMNLYCTIALFYSKARHQMIENENRLRVAREKLKFFSFSTPEEGLGLHTEVLEKPFRKPNKFNEYAFHPKWHQPILPRCYIYMIHELFGEKELPLDKLCNFILTVRGSYRQVPYHNWVHGFAVGGLWFWISGWVV